MILIGREEASRPRAMWRRGTHGVRPRPGHPLSRSRHLKERNRWSIPKFGATRAGKGALNRCGREIGNAFCQRASQDLGREAALPTALTAPGSQTKTNVIYEEVERATRPVLEFQPRLRTCCPPPLPGHHLSPPMDPRLRPARPPPGRPLVSPYGGEGHLESGSTEPGGFAESTRRLLTVSKAASFVLRTIFKFQLRLETLVCPLDTANHGREA